MTMPDRAGPAAPRAPIAWLPLASFALAAATPLSIAAGVIRTDAATERQVLENTRRIALIEAREQPNADKQSLILDRLARIETKLELLAPLKDSVR